METYDPAKAAQIWERVHGGGDSPPPNNDLLPLIAQELLDAATYAHLSRRFQGKDAALLKKLSEEEQAHAACLKGIYTLTTGEKPVVNTPAPTGESAENLLRRCYGREMRALAAYEKRAGHPEYGPVFTRLAQQEQAHCSIVLELLGRLKER